jgi:phage terminase large subunit-like protein
MPEQHQRAMIELQREHDKLTDEFERLRSRDEQARREFLAKHLPPWRRVVLEASWRVYCWAIPKWARI